MPPPNPARGRINVQRKKFNISIYLGYIFHYSVPHSVIPVDMVLKHCDRLDKRIDSLESKIDEIIRLMRINKRMVERMALVTKQIDEKIDKIKLHKK